MSKQFLTIITAALLLSGCATTAGLPSGNDISLPSVFVPGGWERATEASSLPVKEIGWLTRFNDNTLSDLVQKAYLNNPNLKRLQARLDRADARSEKAKAALLPVVDGLAGTSRTDGFEGGNSSADLNLGLDVSWQADIWGRINTAAQANRLDLEAAKFDYEAGYQVLAASVIENYVLAIEAKRLAQVSQSNLGALTKTLGFVTVQFERGLRSGQDISLIRADVASAKVAYNRAEGAARDALRALEILIGTYPDTERVTAAALPDVPIMAAIGQPANILTARPDLKAAQARILAAYAAHKSARAAQKPDLTLGGVLSANTNQFGQILDPSALAATLFAKLTAPIFDGGARKADVAIAQADIDEALANYQDVAIDAFREVERQIDQGQILAQQEIELNQALEDARDALRFTQFRYESAESDLFNVLSAQQRVSFIEAQLVSTRRARLVQYINLSLALGVKPAESL